MTNQITKQQILGKNIQRFRKEKNLSQNELAELLDITREHLAKIETAKRFISLKLLFKLADTLEIPEKFLFDFDVQSRP